MKNWSYVIPLCVATLVTSGCVTVETIIGTEQAPVDIQKQQPSTAGKIWIGKQVAELEDSFGKPQMTMDAPKGGNRNSRIYVYQASAASCMDAFVVDTHQMKVVDHFCR